KKQPSKLFSLSKLQSLLSKKYKMTFKESLDLIQKLYEQGFITYPRTNTEYLAEAEQGKVKSIIEKLNAEGYALEFKDKKSIFDDSKIESHSAITPTVKMPKEDELKGKMLDVYNTIKNRFISNF
ncbi:DNA topoisomerase, partial [Clostridium perfringens]|uniref:DNA topoisomerase n=1 Tax=Clostridium perfringens TaxID=1502 RepID=UPI002247A2E7